MHEISVIVPVYNVQPFLSQCVESILNQSFRDFELILVDDGSPDRCGEICDRYAAADDRIRVIHQKNGGLSAARNAGMEVSKGKYIVFVDSDDMVHPLYLEHLYKAIQKHNADISMCWFSRFEKNPTYDENQAYAEKRILSGREACALIGAAHDRVSTAAWMKMYRADLFRGIRYPVGRIHEDEAVTHQVLYKAKKIVELDEQLCFYRVTPNSIMTSPFSVKRYDAITAYYERYQFYLDNHEMELAKQIKTIADLQKAKYSIMCRNLGIYPEVPVEYKLSLFAALRIIHRLDTEEKFEYWLVKAKPSYARVYSYYRKMKTYFKNESL